MTFALIVIFCEDCNSWLNWFLFLVKGYKDDWVTKEAVAEDADPAENPAQGKQNKEVK